MSDRVPLPADLKRQVLIEAGHRCAIPTCKNPTTEIAHIKPYSEVLGHTFDNLIALCPNCHTRYDRVKDIDRKSMLNYKYNLALMNHRYGRFELTILQRFIDEPQACSILLPGWHDLHMYYLLKDGFIVKTGKLGTVVHGVPAWEEYKLTDSGKLFIENYKNGLLLV